MPFGIVLDVKLVILGLIARYGTHRSIAYCACYRWGWSSALNEGQIATALIGRNPSELPGPYCSTLATSLKLSQEQVDSLDGYEPGEDESVSRASTYTALAGYLARHCMVTTKAKKSARTAFECVVVAVVRRFVGLWAAYACAPHPGTKRAAHEPDRRDAGFHTHAQLARPCRGLYRRIDSATCHPKPISPCHPERPFFSVILRERSDRRISSPSAEILRFAQDDIIVPRSSPSASDAPSSKTHTSRASQTTARIPLVIRIQHL